MQDAAQETAKTSLPDASLKDPFQTHPQSHPRRQHPKTTTSDNRRHIRMTFPRDAPQHPQTHHCPGQLQRHPHPRAHPQRQPLRHPHKTSPKTHSKTSPQDIFQRHPLAPESAAPATHSARQAQKRCACHELCTPSSEALRLPRNLHAKLQSTAPAAKSTRSSQALRLPRHSSQKLQGAARVTQSRLATNSTSSKTLRLSGNRNFHKFMTKHFCYVWDNSSSLSLCLPLVLSSLSEFCFFSLSLSFSLAFSFSSSSSCSVPLSSFHLSICLSVTTTNHHVYLSYYL